VYKGPAAIKQMLIDLYGPTPPDYVNGQSVHISFNAEVSINGDRATAHTRHLLLMRGSSGLPEPMLHGRYDDEFIREAGQWKILRRVDVPVIPTYDEWNRIIRERLAGQ
jgi:SnoaL-like domain